VVLTKKGEKTRAELSKEFHHPPLEIINLDREDLESLLRVLSKVASLPTAES
jgi:hypothetical protein